ncbi:peptide-methionine (S)-S-oxide reductase MsrA [Aureispira anguillae]|uniref:Peptide methionine sulfoxide reductase MsrA n=1 Tax=Aureispira anguillae TaxID=2864201 RepID=A0A915YLX1_9BACT|nr:peptide-methionine (S)-S-oxide reductase MsrA [Aureispira anguillae]BDS15510.1 peptide-methionine (S)-S-oxide reductase MsrA [Aureispira anguillae]
MKNKQIATFGGGCFWCIEAVVQQLKGVEKVVSGYAGGKETTPNYRSVCSGQTGHAEVVQVTFDGAVISYEDLLLIFMTSHDPTTLNRQGADKGTQYRSIILYHNEEQKAIAEKTIDALKELFPNPIVTELVALEKFYPAELYHQNYYNNNSHAGYCQIVINPKIKKLKQYYAEWLKK